MTKKAVHLDSDQVVEIEKVGLLQTYDFIIPEYHNFFANRVLIHNSGAIEQDADMVLLLYRQDYYRSSRKDHDNVAHLRVAKQRHGPTGRIKLTFLPEFLMFADYIPEDDDGEGTEDSAEAPEQDSCAATREQEEQGSLLESGREKAGTAEGSAEDEVPF